MTALEIDLHDLLRRARLVVAVVERRIDDRIVACRAARCGTCAARCRRARGTSATAASPSSSACRRAAASFFFGAGGGAGPRCTPIHASRAFARTRGESALTLPHTACTASRCFVARNASRIAIVSALVAGRRGERLAGLLAIEPLELVVRVALAIVVPAPATRCISAGIAVRLHLAEVAADTRRDRSSSRRQNAASNSSCAASMSLVADSARIAATSAITSPRPGVAGIELRAARRASRGRRRPSLPWRVLRSGATKRPFLSGTCASIASSTVAALVDRRRVRAREERRRASSTCVGASLSSSSIAALRRPSRSRSSTRLHRRIDRLRRRGRRRRGVRRRLVGRVLALAWLGERRRGRPRDRRANSAAAQSRD